MHRSAFMVVAGLALIAGSIPATVANADVGALLDELNGTRSVRGGNNSYQVIFDAYLNLEEPPVPLGPDFNHFMIHPGMSNWTEVAGWAEGNPEMAEALLKVEETTLFGLPYGLDAVAEKYKEKLLYADIAVGGSLSVQKFGYLEAVETIAAFACSETYRLLEAGQYEEGFRLAMAHIMFLRQCCDREFLGEQFYAINLLGESLDNLRDMFWVYRNDAPSELFAEMAMASLPHIRVDRSRLFMGEGDRKVAEALLREVFDDEGFPIPDQFVDAFSHIQAEDQPLVLFGAARRWRSIAGLHDSLDASLERLNLVYDDWWRRWRVQEYDPILAFETEYDRLNSVRHAAVKYALRDIADLFGVRNVLLAKVEGTAVAAGLVAYYRNRGNWPRDLEALYAVQVKKRSNRDIFDVEFGVFKYDLAGGSTTIETAWGRVRPGISTAMLWSKGSNLEDDRASEHTDDGSVGDIVLWPPIKAMLRESGDMP